jgi:hypothetical protein
MEGYTLEKSVSTRNFSLDTLPMPGFFLAKVIDSDHCLVYLNIASSKGQCCMKINACIVPAQLKEDRDDKKPPTCIHAMPVR